MLGERRRAWTPPGQQGTPGPKPGLGPTPEATPGTAEGTTKTESSEGKVTLTLKSKLVGNWFLIHVSPACRFSFIPVPPDWFNVY